MNPGGKSTRIGVDAQADRESDEDAKKNAENVVGGVGGRGGGAVGLYADQELRGG